MDKISASITNYFVEKNIIPPEKREIYQYGFNLIFADLVNFAIIMLLSIILGQILNGILFLISLCSVRRFSGGFHAKSFWLCRLSMIITYLCVICLSGIISAVKGSVFVISALDASAILFIAIFAPVEHPNKPLSSESRKRNKIKAVIAACVLSAASILLTAVKISSGVTISITLSATVFLMLVAMIIKKGGKSNV